MLPLPLLRGKNRLPRNSGYSHIPDPFSSRKAKGEEYYPIIRIAAFSLNFVQYKADGSMNGQTIAYLIRFLVGEAVAPDNLLQMITYARPGEESPTHRVVIVPSNFFALRVYGTENGYPRLPLEQWHGVPLLYGEAREEQPQPGGVIYIYADIIASTFFLVSRYEEIYKRNIRDEHGRFPGRESLPCRAGFLHRPIVDEYGQVLRTIMRSIGIEVADPPPGYSRVNLTHDIDIPFLYRGFRSFCRAILRERKSPIEALRRSYTAPLSDPAFTFPRFLEWNKSLQHHLGRTGCSTIFFLKAPLHPEAKDRPTYNLRSWLYRPIMQLARRYNVHLGLHVSYAAGLKPALIADERHNLRRSTGAPVDISRHHYLTFREPEDFLQLVNSGIYDDYTMGYADCAGFRLGTSRPVHFIRPSTRSLSELIMHPLVIMDCSLDRPNYMNLSYDEALAYCHGIISESYKHGGELNLLWHNENLSRDLHRYHAQLYRRLLRLIPDPEARGTVGNEV